MIIRTVFNNQNWQSPCKKVKDDQRLFKCHKKVVNTPYRRDKKGNCKGEDCWEVYLCKKYRWPGVSNKEKAKGNVFFVFSDTDNSLVLWGMSKVKKVDKEKEENYVYFEKFEPWPEEKWIRGLSAKDLIGKHWGNGTFRYIDSKKEDKIKKLIKEIKKIKK
ncbi:MAG: hypothetical protein ABIK90_01360 [candidate division WOR-3 bacterium]